MKTEHPPDFDDLTMSFYFKTALMFEQIQNNVRIKITKGRKSVHLTRAVLGTF